MHTDTLAPLFQTPGPYATAFVDVTRGTEAGAHEQELHVREATDQLAAAGADERALEAIRERLAEAVRRPGPASRFVVATAGGVAYDEVVSGHPDRPVATWGPLPDLTPLVAHRDSAVTFVLALVDHTGGELRLFDSDVPEPEVELTAGGETQYVQHVPQGDFASLQFQRSTENVWRHNADAVVDELATLVRSHHVDLVLLAGDPTSVSIVQRDLPDLPVRLVELPTGQRAEDGGEEALDEAVRQALLDEVVRRRTDLTHQLRDRLGRGEAAATGVRDVAEAFTRGQVETLLLDPAGAAELDLEPEKVPGLAFGKAEVTEKVPADQALVAAAVLTDADVSVLPATALGGAPVTALLRWDQ